MSSRSEGGRGIGGRIEDGYELSDPNARLLKQFVAFVRSANEQSAQNRHSNTKAWMKWCEESKRDINAVDKADLLIYLDDLMLTDGKKHAHTSIGARIGSISRFYTWANGRKHLEANPCEKFEFEQDYPQIDPNVSQKYIILRRKSGDEDSNAILSISQETIRNIVEYASSDRNELVIRLFQQTGIRASDGRLLSE